MNHSLKIISLVILYLVIGSDILSRVILYSTVISWVILQVIHTVSSHSIHPIPVLGKGGVGPVLRCRRPYMYGITIAEPVGSQFYMNKAACSFMMVKLLARCREHNCVLTEESSQYPRRVGQLGTVRGTSVGLQVLWVQGPPARVKWILVKAEC